MTGDQQSDHDMRSDLAAYYDNEAASGARFAMTSRGRRDELRTDFVDLLVREGRSNLLEIGSGPGTDASTFTDAGVSYVGYDLAFGNGRLAQDNDITVLQASLFAPPFRSRAFDAGWTMSTFLHVPDAQIHDAFSASFAPYAVGSPIAIGLWGGLDREGIKEADHFDPPRFFSNRSDERLRHMLSEHGEVESFESWPSFNGVGTYQFVVLRV